MDMIAPIIRLLRCTKGNAALEMGIIFPIFVALMLGVSQYGLAIFQFMEVGYAAQVGANYALTNGFNAANIQTAVTSATGLSTITAPLPTQACFCASLTPAIGLSAATCGATCASGGTAGVYVTVKSSAVYSPALPGMPSPMTGQAVVRIQ
jgi:Flp pilus assembly protein TadG